MKAGENAGSVLRRKSLPPAGDRPRFEGIRNADDGTPWIVAGSLALSIALALIARRPREFDMTRFPRQVQQSGIGGLMFSVMFLFVFGHYVTWWSPAPIIGAGVVLWLLAGLLPRFARLAPEVFSVLAWPFSLIVAAFALTHFVEHAS